MRQTIHASFANPDTATKAVAALIDHNVSPNDISVFVKDVPAAWSDHLKTGADIQKQATEGITLTTPQDAVEGGAKGAGIGLGLGVLAAVAAVTVPGVGLVLGGGALATALAGAVATTAAGAFAGAAVGYLKDQGVDEETARTLTETVEGGGALVSVTAPSNNVMLGEMESILGKYADQDTLVRVGTVETARVEPARPYVT